MDIFHWRESALKCHTTKLLFPKLIAKNQAKSIFKIFNMLTLVVGNKKNRFFGVPQKIHKRIEGPEWRVFRNLSLRIVHRVSATFVVVKDI